METCRKVQYDTRAQAKAARRKTYATRTERDGPLNIYRCTYCGFYHLGHMPPEVRNGTTDKDEWLERRA